MKFIKKHPKELNSINCNKYNKSSLKRRSFNNNISLSSLLYGTIGIKILENCKLQYYQFESLRKFFLPYTKGFTKIWFRGDFRTPLTKKSIGTRMGKGKGKLDHWVSNYKRGQIFLEFERLDNELQYSKLLKRLKFRLPFKFCLIFKNNVNKFD